MKYLKLYEAVKEYSFQVWFDMNKRGQHPKDITIIDHYNLYKQHLTSLKGIENLTNLTWLECDDNKELNSLEGIENLTKLTYLSCYYCSLTSLEPIKDLINLEKLYCLFNPLKTLKGIENCINIIELECVKNELTTLEPLRNLKKLNRLLAGDNYLQDLRGIEDLENLAYLFVDSNPFDNLSLEDAYKILMSIENKKSFEKGTDINKIFQEYNFQKKVVEEQPENIKYLKTIGIIEKIKEEYKEILSFFNIT